MKFPRSCAALAGAAVLLLAVPHAFAQDVPVLEKHVPAKVRNGEAAPVAPVDTSRRLQLAISLPLRNEAALDALLKDLYDPQSPNFHHFLSAQEFTANFSPTQQEYDAAVQWAQSKGLQITGLTPNRRVIDVDGSVDAINRAFHVQLTHFQDAGTARTFRAPDREPTVDAPVALLAISGLDDANPPQPHYRKGNGISVQGNTSETTGAIAHITGSGPGNTYLPSDMRKAYYGTGPLTGAGQTVAIFSYDGYIANDINVYYSSTGMANTVPVQNVLVNGYNGACFGFNPDGSINNSICDDGEQILDIVNVIGMAPGLSQVLFYEGNLSVDVLNRMATDNIAKSISSSWGGGDFGPSSVPAFKQFQAQGQSYLNATGDSGQFNSSTYAPPSVDPNITQVGGTNLTTTGAGGPWSGEVAWPYSGGGYVSGTAIPSYQQQAGVINANNKGSTTLRNAPDVAMEANFDNTTVINGVFKSGYGGTSFAAPRWAGLVALANQQAALNGKPTVGFLNPAVYTIGLGANFTSNFHDVVSGNNKPTAGAGSGFNAVAGYDLVTGWGSPVGAALIATLVGGGTTPTPDFTLSTSPSSLSVAAGSTGSSTVTVTPISGFTGSVALSASGLPAGVTASFSPASTTSTSTLTLTVASTATAGSSTVTITGVSGSLTHTTTLALTVTAAGGNPTQLIVNPGFETGSASPWSMTAGVLCRTTSCTHEAAHTGSYFAWLDGYGRAHTDTVQQQVAIPAGKTSATLSFYLHIDTAETGAAANDVFTVSVLNTSGALLGTLATYSNLNAVAGYQQRTFNMNAYIGKTVVLKFNGVENSSLATSFVLDDITLNVQ